MAKHEREVRRMYYLDRWYPLVATGLVKMSANEFLEHYKQYMINELGTCTDDDIAWAKQYIAKLEAYNHA